MNKPTTCEVEQLKTLILDGHSSQVIATKINKSHWATRAMIMRNTPGILRMRHNAKIKGIRK